MSTTKPPCEFPVPDFDGPTVAFGADRKSYLTQEQLGDWYGRENQFHEAAQSLFFNGGKLADHGLKWKEGIDGAKAMRALRGLLASFAPKHEIKIGTCGSRWRIGAITRRPRVRRDHLPRMPRGSHERGRLEIGNHAMKKFLDLLIFAIAAVEFGHVVAAIRWYGGQAL